MRELRLKLTGWADLFWIVVVTHLKHCTTNKIGPSGEAPDVAHHKAYEGLGLRPVEAPLAELSALMSDAMTPEVELGCFCRHQMSLSAGPNRWAEALLEEPERARSNTLPLSAAAAKFDIVRSLGRLCLHYTFVTALKYKALRSSTII